jgi:regulatory protein
MQITAVERHPQRRSRVLVYVDGIAAMEIARSAARTRDLRPGRATTREEIDAIIAAEQRREALATAAALLARRPRSERELRQRLARRKTPAPVIDETVARLYAARLLDDAAFAHAWAEARDRTSPRSARLVTAELRARGVRPEVASAAAVAGIDDDDAAYRLASRRAASMRDLGYETFRTRLAGLLRRRGFGWSVVQTTVERCWREAAGDARSDIDATAAGPEFRR